MIAVLTLICLREFSFTSGGMSAPLSKYIADGWKQELGSDVIDHRRHFKLEILELFQRAISSPTVFDSLYQFPSGDKVSQRSLPTFFKLGNCL
jgi:hypothetical protein